MPASASVACREKNKSHIFHRMGAQREKFERLRLKKEFTFEITRPHHNTPVQHS